MAILGVGFYVISNNFFGNDKKTISVKPDNSLNRIILEAKENVSIDFEKCEPDTTKIYVAFGSTTIEVERKREDYCILNYGGEIENPEWDGKLTTSCKVPLELKNQVFKKSNYGVDFSSIQQYCSERK